MRSAVVTPGGDAAPLPATAGRRRADAAGDRAWAAVRGHSGSSRRARSTDPVREHSGGSARAR
ncbi:hypothetical protein EBB07_10580 [Paenibacillaceae bacterium]|nr:hypothetical protein EBB07_10580 [Paenibacillaceae bacterium]